MSRVRKFSKKLLSRFSIGCVGTLRVTECPKPDCFAGNNDGRAVATASFVEPDSFKAGDSSWNRYISLVLLTCRFAEVAPPIIAWIAIPMVNLYWLFACHNHPRDAMCVVVPAIYPDYQVTSRAKRATSWLSCVASIETSPSALAFEVVSWPRFPFNYAGASIIVKTLSQVGGWWQRVFWHWRFLRSYCDIIPQQVGR